MYPPDWLKLEKRMYPHLSIIWFHSFQRERAITVNFSTYGEK